MLSFMYFLQPFKHIFLLRNHSIIFVYYRQELNFKKIS